MCLYIDSDFVPPDFVLPQLLWWFHLTYLLVTTQEVNKIVANTNLSFIRERGKLWQTMFSCRYV